MIEKVRATIEDIDALGAMETKYFPSPWTKAQFEEEMKNNPFSRIFLLKDENKIVGYIDYWIMCDEAQINNIYREEEYRRQQLGEYLMKEAFKEMKENEVFSITLEVRVSNIKAQRLYEKLGFKNTLLKKSYYSDGEDAFYMVKGGFEL